MFIIMGGTGHVGSATAEALLAQGQPVTLLTRSAERGAPWRDRGAQIAVADVGDLEALRAAFRLGQRLFLLNPPADPSTDTDATEKETIRCILQALDGSGLEKIVAQSTYGAQPGSNCGDLNTLFELEQGLRRQKIPHAILRAAYYMSNWDALVETAGKTGTLPTVYPADLRIPMVAPVDLGAVAARLLQAPIDEGGIHPVEGPERYSSGDVAAALGSILGRPVVPDVTPRDAWEEAYRALGFSPAAARSYTRMTAVSVDEDFDMPTDPERGQTTLRAYLAGRVQA